jgi:hypothetical protein
MRPWGEGEGGEGEGPRPAAIDHSIAVIASGRRVICWPTLRADRRRRSRRFAAAVDPQPTCCQHELLCSCVSQARPSPPPSATGRSVDMPGMRLSWSTIGKMQREMHLVAHWGPEAPGPLGPLFSTALSPLRCSQAPARHPGPWAAVPTPTDP